MSTSRVLSDHDQIREWAEDRGARPAAVIGTGGDDDIGVIRLDFPGYSGALTLKHIDWDEWFRKFDGERLALIVQDETAEGAPSNFNKIVKRETLEAQTRRKTRSRLGRITGHH